MQYRDPMRLVTDEAAAAAGDVDGSIVSIIGSGGRRFSYLAASQAQAPPRFFSPIERAPRR